MNITRLKIPTGRRQTSRLDTKRDRGFELGTTEKQIQLVTGTGLEPGTSGLQHQRPKPLGHACLLTKRKFSRFKPYTKASTTLLRFQPLGENIIQRKTFNYRFKKKNVYFHYGPSTTQPRMKSVEKILKIKHETELFYSINPKQIFSLNVLLAMFVFSHGHEPS